MGLKKTSRSVSTDNSGAITFEELKDGLNISKSEVEQLMDVVDVNGDSTISYLEFITTTKYMNRMDQEDKLYTSFQYLDKDNSGYIAFAKS
eukprot:Gb_16905 [translate_table: standard]